MGARSTKSRVAEFDIMQQARLVVALVAGLLAVCLPGAADATAAAQIAPPSPPKQTVPERIEPGTSGSSLSDKLNRSHGVIHPPSDVDTGIAQPPPAMPPHSTPVLPPPGSPGGNPRVEPK
jgi:hypothetical protein